MQIDELIILIKGQLKNAAVFSNVDRRMAQTEKRAHRLRNAFGGLFSIGGLAGGIGGIFAVRGFIDTAKHVDRIQTRFETITGTMEGVNSLFKESGRIANSYGLDLKTTEEGLSMLLGSMKGSSFTMQEGVEMYDNISRAVAGMKLSTDEAKGALLAFSQIISKGKVQAEELRRQLANRMPGAFPIAAQALFPNLTGEQASAKLDQSLRDGSVTSKALIKIAKALADNFGKNAEKAANRVIGSINKMGNAWEEFKRKVAAGGMGEGLIKGANAIEGLLRSKELLTLASGAGKFIGVVADNLLWIVNLGVVLASLWGVKKIAAIGKVVFDFGKAALFYLTSAITGTNKFHAGTRSFLKTVLSLRKMFMSIGIAKNFAGFLAGGWVGILVGGIILIITYWKQLSQVMDRIAKKWQSFTDKIKGIKRESVTYDPNKLTDAENLRLEEMIKMGTTDVFNPEFTRLMNKAGANIQPGTISATTYNNNSNININNELYTNSPDVADKFIKELPDDIQKAQKDYESAH